MSIDKGLLYVVATPIGNLADMTFRAVDVLSQVDLIAAEDTRVTRQLLKQYGITTRCIPVHEHNERKVAQRLINRLLAGESAAIVSDAGTPLLSDPGYILVCLAHEQGIRVIPVPGSDSATAALAVSGLPTDRFIFEGFLPATANARRRRLLELSAEARTMVFFEAARRLASCLADMIGTYGNDRPAALVREMTKIHERVISSTLGELHIQVTSDRQLERGEAVLIVAGLSRNKTETHSECAEATLRILLDYLPLKQAVRAAQRITGAPKNWLYRVGLNSSEPRDSHNEDLQQSRKH